MVTYIQSAFTLDSPCPPKQSIPVAAPLIADSYGGWASVHRHTPTASGRRLPADFWNGYRLECETRERLHLPDVSLVEFRDMRDWTDTIEETNHDDDYSDHDILRDGCHP